MSALTRGWAERDPVGPAVRDERGMTTWAELDGRANRLVSALRRAGLGPGDRVALLTGNRREVGEATVACLSAHWLIVPVNWHLSVAEVAHILADSGAAALILDERSAELGAAAAVSAPALRVRLVTGDRGLAGHDPYEGALAGADPGEPDEQAAGAWMFYTSGTTGRPKGVVTAGLPAGEPVESRAAMAEAWSQAFLGSPEGGRTLLCGPAYHSAQAACALLPLVAGRTLVMLEQASPKGILDAIDRERITNLHLVPTQFIRLLRLPEERRRAFDGSSLVRVLHSGAPCPPQVKRRMIEWWGPRITEAYGASEIGYVAAVDSESWLARPGTAGRLFPDVECVVVGEDGHRLEEPGQEGLLYFRRRGRADFHYHQDPQKTAAVHLEPGLATVGDVGWIDPDGFLFVSDRRIDMIITGGANVYPAEVEAALLEHPAVADAAVFGVPDEEFGEQVKAVVELRAGGKPSAALEAELVDFVRAAIAHYKAPRSVDFWPRLPRQENGKLQKRLLRDPYWGATGRRL